MKKIALGIFVLIAFSCQKDYTSTCECKDAYGQTLSKNVNTVNSKKDNETFKSNCRKKNIKSSNTINGVTTSTVVPCEAYDS